jgi:drug/metabolite transporter (DMT)-like permease
LNSTALVQDLDRQWNDLIKFEAALSSNKALEMEPSSDFTLMTGAENAASPSEWNGLSDLWKARLLLVGAAALYGTNFSLVKHLGDIMPVGISTSLRFAAAVLVTLPWLLKDLRKNDDALMAAWLGFEVGLWNSIGYVSQAVGLDTTPAAESAFICSLAVVTVPILDFCAGKKLLSRQWIGVILAVVGVAFLELVGSSSSSHTMSTGDLLTMVQPFAFGLGFWRMESAMRRFPDHASRMTAAQLLAVFLSSVAYGLWAIDMPTLQSFPWDEWMTSSSVIFSILWTGIITTALSIYMENKAMQTLSAAETTLIFSTEPLWGAAFAGLVMGEQLGPNVALGATFIMTACLYSNLGMAGMRNLWQDSMASLGSVCNSRLGTVAANDLPLRMQQPLAWFSSSVATSWAWWRVAASNISTLDDVTDLLEETATNLLEKVF